jgi:HTH-type transcriptional regulator, competence development regulator
MRLKSYIERRGKMSEILGKRLKYIRDKKGVSQTFVAGKIGVKNNTLSGYESGRREPDSETLRKLAEFYEVSTDYLLGVSDTPSYKGNGKDFEPLEEINKLVKKYGIDQMGFFDIEDWKKLGPDDIRMLEEQFKLIVRMAEKRINREDPK